MIKTVENSKHHAYTTYQHLLKFVLLFEDQRFRKKIGFEYKL